MGSCLTLSNIPSEETRILTTQETLGRDAWTRSSRLREPGRAVRHMAPGLGFVAVGLVSGLSLAGRLAHQRCVVAQGPSCGAHVTRPMSIAM